MFRGVPGHHTLAMPGSNRPPGLGLYGLDLKVGREGQDNRVQGFQIRQSLSEAFMGVLYLAGHFHAALDGPESNVIRHAASAWKSANFLAGIFRCVCD